MAMTKHGTFVAVLVAAMALAIFGTTPPAPQGADIPSSSFSAARAMADVRVVASTPHPTGSAENAAVRAHLIRRMQSMGMEVTTSAGMIDERGTAKYARWNGRNDPPKPLVNLIGILPGKDRALPAVMLMSHHDTVWGSPGAADDTAGLAASLEVVRAVSAQGEPQRDLMVLITDGEELGLQGARQFFASHPLREKIGAIVNLEARGGGGRSTMFQTSAANGAAMALFADNVPRPAASSLAAYIYSVLPNDTDLTPALKGPYAAYNFAFIGRPGLYHSPLSTPDRLDQGALQDMGDQVLGLTRGLLVAKQLPAPAQDAVFFDLFGLLLVIYPAWLGWIMLLVATSGFALALRQNGRAGVAAGVGRMSGLIVTAGVLLYAFNWLSLGAGPPNYYDRLAAIPLLEVQAGLVLMAVYMFTLGRQRAAPGTVVGAALPLLLIALAGQALAPTAAYFIVVPIMLTGLVMAARGHMPARAGAALIAANAVAVTGFMLALGHQVMQGVGPTMPMAAVLPFSLAVVTLLPLWRGLAQRTARITGICLLLMAGGVALWVQLDPVADSVPAYADTKR